MNTAQRAGLLVSIFLLACLTVAHFPFDGYISEITVSVPRLGPPCPPMPSLEELNKLDSAGSSAVLAGQKGCGSGVDYVTTEFPFTDWVSRGALVDSLSRVKNVLVTLALLVIGTALWVFHFRRRDA